MNKTPHRLLHDALTDEQYKQVLVNMRRGFECKKGFLRAGNASDALITAFKWGLSVEGDDYWDAIYDLLLERGL